MAAASEAEAPVVDDIWKACAYGDLEKLRDFMAGMTSVPPLRSVSTSLVLTLYALNF